MRSQVTWAPRPLRASVGWVAARWVMLVGFLGIIVMLFVKPNEALRWVWFGFVPLLPASFLVNAEAWRNVCPLATLNTIRSDDDDGRPLDRRAARISTLVGIALLLLAISARIVVLNRSATATALLLSVAGALSLLSGLRYRRKAGFCNSVCPILPVERLYGQRPLVSVQNARCTPCQVCTRAACFDLNPGRSALQIFGAGAPARPWMLLPFGIFALAFPGAIVGYYLVSPTPAADVGTAMGMIIGGGLSSWGVLGFLAAIGKVRAADGLLLAALMAALVFYWFTPPSIVSAFSLRPGAVPLLRLAGVGLVALWALRAFRPETPVELTLRRPLS